jgi:hypothetical protein
MADILRRYRVTMESGEVFEFTRMTDGRFLYERTHSRPGGATLPDDEGEITAPRASGQYVCDLSGPAATREVAVTGALHRPDSIGVEVLVVINGVMTTLGHTKHIEPLIGGAVGMGKGYL